MHTRGTFLKVNPHRWSWSSRGDVCCCVWDIQYDCIYQNDKEKNNSLYLFVPRDATAVPYWELWALAC